MNAELANIRELARITRLPARWLYREAIEGRLPCLRVSKNQLIFNVEAVRARLVERAASSTAEVCSA